MKGELVDKRRECKSCGHVDRILVREQIVSVLEVESRVRIHTQPAPLVTTSRYDAIVETNS